MNYKKIFLTVLLVPLASICDDTALNARMKMLTEQYFQKELELSKLGRMIAKRDNFLSSFSENVSMLIRDLSYSKIKELESKNNGHLLSEEERQRITVETKKWADDFLYAFFAVCDKNENIDGMLMQGLFKQGSIMDEFESLRFYLIRSTFERSLRMRLVKKYEDCIKEMLVLKADIETLNLQLAKD